MFEKEIREGKGTTRQMPVALRTIRGDMKETVIPALVLGHDSFKHSDYGGECGSFRLQIVVILSVNKYIIRPFQQLVEISAFTGHFWLIK